MVVGWTTQLDAGSTVEYTCDGCGHFTAEGNASRYSIPAYTPPYTSPLLHCTAFVLFIVCPSERLLHDVVMLT
jgi:hypothetical protein